MWFVGPFFYWGFGGKRLRLEGEKWVRPRKGVPIASAGQTVMQVNGRANQLI